MSDAIRITDLADPQLSEAQRGALAYADTLQVELSSHSILQEARQATGLENFGPTDFLERLELLCDEWGGDSGLVNLGAKWATALTLHVHGVAAHPLC